MIGLVLLFVALWFILRGDLLYVFPCVILFLWFLVLLVLRLPQIQTDKSKQAQIEQTYEKH